jgi:hypothetical protein
MDTQSFLLLLLFDLVEFYERLASNAPRHLATCILFEVVSKET